MSAELTPDEKRHLENARTHKGGSERYALEEFGKLWDSLDGRLGEDNPVTKGFVREYEATSYQSPRDYAEDRRTQVLRTAFVMPRTGVPFDVRMALLVYNVGEGRGFR